MFELNIKQTYGEHAIHIPMWLVAQDQGDVTSFVGATRDPRLRYGSDRCHQLILGEMIVRPHLVIGSDAHKGAGLTGLIHSLDIREWVDGDIIADPLGKLAELTGEPR